MYQVKNTWLIRQRKKRKRANGLAYSDLTIAQGSGSHSSHTIISKTSSSEYLAVVEGLSASVLTEVDFVGL